MRNATRRNYISLGIAGAIFALAGALGVDTENVYQERVLRERELLRAEAEAQRSLHAVRDQLELAQHMSSRYRALQEQGLFDDINKPAAIDRAESALRPYAAAVTRYQIGGSHEVAPSPLDQSAQYQIQIERVAVDFEPLHEERFLHVWDAITSLRGPAGGVESCELHRATGPTAGVPAPANPSHKAMPIPLTARCLLTWYRLRAAPTSDGGAASSASPSRAKS